MVAFHDRRKVVVTPSDLPRGSGESLSRTMIRDTFFVKSHALEQGREYSVQEVLPSGHILEREVGHPTRYAARKSATTMNPTSVHEI